MNVEKVTPSNQMLSISATAKEHLLRYLESNNTKSLRLTLKKYGCSGFGYELIPIQSPEETDVDAHSETDLTIYVEKKFFPMIKGTHIDFVQEGLNRKLIYQNPNQTGECGCGESFIFDTI